MTQIQKQDVISEFIESKNKTGITIKVMGYQAIARGAYEAGVTLWAGFPGIPSNQLVEAYKSICNGENGVKRVVEFATNDKVALETALGGSMCNARTVVSMTHQGLNIAADSFMTACYAGALGGMVVITVDDPGITFSQSEVDNRYYGLHGIIPIFEPSTIQEAKDLMKFAFSFSEQYESLVLFRVSAELNFSQGDLLLGELEPVRTQFQFDESQRMRWTHLPTNARVNRVKILDRMKNITTFAESFPFNKEIIRKNAKVGIIASGPVSYKLNELFGEGKDNTNISLGHLSMTYPLARGKIQEFLKKHEKIIIIEELEPILESAIKSIAFEMGYSGEIFGKTMFSRSGIITAEKIKQILKEKFKIDSKASIQEIHPQLPLSDCGKIPDFILKRLENLKKSSNTSFYIGTDMGCELSNSAISITSLDISLSVGATMGIVNGIVKLDPQVPVTICSHEIFLHSGVSALINAIYNENPQLSIIFQDVDSNNESAKQNFNIDYDKFRISIGIPDTHFHQLSFETIKKDPKLFDQVFNEALKLPHVRMILIKNDTKGGN